MSIKKHLNQTKYKYQWSNERKTSYQTILYKSKLKIDKTKGEEVIQFIEGILEKHGLEKTQKNIETIENTLHKIPTIEKEKLQKQIENEFEFKH